MQSKRKSKIFDHKQFCNNFYWPGIIHVWKIEKVKHFDKYVFQLKTILEKFEI